MMRFWAFGFLFFFLQYLLSAQECAPDPGPAVFFEDFGSGAGQGPALASGTTTYNFGGINDGSYLISNTTGINGSFWHEGFDHTEGDVDGYMLLVNAEAGADIFYQKNQEVCPNTDYVFSSFIANVVVPTGCIGDAEKPDIRFSVVDPGNGSTLATMTTGEIFYSSFLTWRPYTLTFRTGPNQTSLLLQLINNAPGGCGNDLAIDDISLRLCNVQLEQSFDLCDLPDGSITVGTSTYTEPGVYLDAIPVPNTCNDTLITTTLTGITRLLPTLRYTFCEGDMLEVDGRLFTTSTSFVDTLSDPTVDCPQYQPYEIIAQSLLSVSQEITLCNGESVQVGNNNLYTEAGTYVDTLSTLTGCDSVVITTIRTGDIEVEVIPSVVEVAFGESVPLMGSVSLSSGFTLSWQPPEFFSCTDCSTPLLQPFDSGIYQLVATDIFSGCADSATVQVTVQTCEKVYVPNGFSPNFDNVNDYFELFAEDCFIRLVSWRVFDRWGGLVYETTDQPLNNTFIGWDGQAKGKAADQGIYTYELLLERDNGTLKKMSGEVVLLY